jgi:hypothetical protein
MSGLPVADGVEFGVQPLIERTGRRPVRLRRHAKVDRRHRRHQLHRDPKFNVRCDRPIGMPLRVA